MSALSPLGDRVRSCQAVKLPLMMPISNREDTNMIGWKQTTEDRYWDMLGCVPPIAQRGFGFLVGEAADHRKCKISGQFAPRYDAFIEVNSRFFESVDPITVLEWMAIEHSEIAELNPA